MYVRHRGITQPTRNLWPTPESDTLQLNELYMDLEKHLLKPIIFLLYTVEIPFG